MARTNAMRRFTFHKLIITTLAVSILGLGGCQSTPPAEKMVRQIEKAHNIDAWKTKPALQCDLTIILNGKVLSQSQLLMTTDGHHVRMDRSDKTILIWDSNEAWVHPANAKEPLARFELLTWSYFIAAPFKLADPGSALTPLEPASLIGKRKFHERAKLTFEQGVGDTPEDWYIIYQDPDTHRLEALAYIITYGNSKEKAEKDPHVLIYKDVMLLDDIPLSTTWNIYNWNEKEGLGKKIGSGKLTNLRFIDTPIDAFIPPENSRTAPLPGS